MPFKQYQAPNYFLYKKKIKRSYLYVRHLRQEDLNTLYDWFNHPSARRFWNMQLSQSELLAYFENQKHSTSHRIFIICHGKMPIALSEVYEASRSELAFHYTARRYDYGIHLLMAPPRNIVYLKQLIGKVSLSVLLTIIEMLFKSDSVKRIIAEPDINNTCAQHLALAAGFQFVKDLQLSDKVAKLYIISR
jgi:RimJ/RimL family protein N-acetyltransferase